MNSTVKLTRIIKLPYSFEVGQHVQHISGGMLAAVYSRSRTALGREIYEVHLADKDDERPIRHILGDFIEAAV